MAKRKSVKVTKDKGRFKKYPRLKSLRRHDNNALCDADCQGKR